MTAKKKPTTAPKPDAVRDPAEEAFKPTPTIFKAPTPEEANARAIAYGQAPIDSSMSLVRPITDPAPTMSSQEAARMFLVPVAGGPQPDWYVDGVVRPERMSKEHKEIWDGPLDTVGTTDAEDPNALPTGTAPIDVPNQGAAGPMGSVSTPTPTATTGSTPVVSASPSASGASSSSTGSTVSPHGTTSGPPK